MVFVARARAGACLSVTTPQPQVEHVSGHDGRRAGDDEQEFTRRMSGALERREEQQRHPRNEKTERGGPAMDGAIRVPEAQDAEYQRSNTKRVLRAFADCAAHRVR